MDFIFEILTKFAFRQYTLLPICDEEKYEKNSEKDQKIAKIWMKRVKFNHFSLWKGSYIYHISSSSFTIQLFIGNQAKPI